MKLSKFWQHCYEAHIPFDADIQIEPFQQTKQYALVANQGKRHKTIILVSNFKEVKSETQ